VAWTPPTPRFMTDIAANVTYSRPTLRVITVRLITAFTGFLMLLWTWQKLLGGFPKFGSSSPFP